MTLANASYACILHAASALDRLQDNRINAVAVDPQGTIWVGTPMGLSKVVREGHAGDFYLKRLRDDPAFAGQGVQSICAGAAETIWLGTLERGLVRWNPLTAEFSIHPLDQSRFSAQWRMLIRAIHEDRAGKIWLVTPGALIRFDPVTATFSYLQHDPNNPRSLPPSGIASIWEDHGGILWLGSNGNGLFKYDPKAKPFEQNPAATGSLWRGASIRSLCETRDGVLWIGTADARLYQMNRSAKRGAPTERAEVTPFQRRLPNGEIFGNGNVVYSMLEDRSGELWFGTGNGLFRLNPVTGTLKDYQVGPLPYKGFEGRSGQLMDEHEPRSQQIQSAHANVQEL